MTKIDVEAPDRTVDERPMSYQELHHVYGFCDRVSLWALTWCTTIAYPVRPREWCPSTRLLCMRSRASSPLAASRGLSYSAASRRTRSP
jgi:hypothetical protein